MTLEERIADVLRGKRDGPMTDEALARAVVAVLQTADVSDEQIKMAHDAERHRVGGRANWDIADAAAVTRRFLDTQAAAHAAYVIEVRSEYEKMLRDSATEAASDPSVE